MQNRIIIILFLFLKLFFDSIFTGRILTSEFSIINCTFITRMQGVKKKILSIQRKQMKTMTDEIPND